MPLQSAMTRVQDTLQPYRGRLLDRTHPAVTSSTVYPGEGLIVAVDRRRAAGVGAFGSADGIVLATLAINPAVALLPA